MVSEMIDGVKKVIVEKFSNWYGIWLEKDSGGRVGSLLMCSTKDEAIFYAKKLQEAWGIEELEIEV